MSAAGVLREELAEVDARLAEDAAFRERFNDDYTRGFITAEQWSRLEADVGARMGRRRPHGTTCGRSSLRSSMTSPLRTSTGVLDHIGVIREMVDGRLTAESTPALNAQLREVFEEFRISSRPNDAGSGTRLIVEPRLRTD